MIGVKAAGPLNNHFIVNKHIVSDKKEIVNQFNEYFTGVGYNLANAIPTVDNRPQDYLKGHHSNSFFVTPITVDEVVLYRKN